MKNPFILLAVILLSITGYSQTWQKTWGASGNDYPTAITLDASGNYIVAGYTDDNSAFTLQLDSAGSINWEKKYTIGSSAFAINDITVNSSGDLIACGTLGDVFINSNPCLIKLSSTGSLSTIKKLAPPMWGLSHGIFSTGVNDVYVTGGFPSYSKWNSSTMDTVWAKDVDGCGGGFVYEYSYAFEASDGNIVLGGEVNTCGMFLLTKITPNGDTVWTKNEDMGNIGKMTGGIGLADGSIITCLKGSNSHLIKWDSNGNIIWIKSYSDGGTLSIEEIIPSPSGGFYCSGTTDGQGAGNSDFFLMKTDDGGTLQWMKVYGSLQADELTDAVIDNEQNIIMIGITLGYSAQGKDVYVVKVDSLGNADCNFQTGNASTTTASVSLTNEMNFASSSYTINTPVVNEVTSSNSDSLLCTSITSISKLMTSKIQFTLYPNPVDDVLNLSFDDDIDQVIIYNITGSVLKKIDGSASIISVTDLPRGIFIIEVHSDSGTAHRRFVKQ